MGSKYLLSFAVLCLAVIAPACGQGVITDMETCDTLSLNCGTEEGGFREKYCCYELNGRFPIHKCCNPYIALSIGLCVGIPLLIAIIVGIIIAYWWCARYQNRKMDRLMIAYRQAQLEEEEEERNSEPENPAAPPAYTPVASAGRDPKAGLPEYTESDPFASRATTDADSTGNLDNSPQDSQPWTEPATETELEDIPLISDNEEEA